MKFSKFVFGFASVALAGSLFANTGLAALVYVDADYTAVTGNTFPTAGGVLVDGGNNGTDNEWRVRSGFGDGGVVEASADEDTPELTTTITGLIAGDSYDIYVNFLDKPSNLVETWGVMGGLTSGSLAYYSSDFDAATTGGISSLVTDVLDYEVGSEPTLDATFHMYSGFLGSAVADASGEIEAYAGNYTGTDGVNRRTWFEGFSVGPTAVPEPTALLLVGMGLMLSVSARRQ